MPPRRDTNAAAAATDDATDEATAAAANAPPPQLPQRNNGAALSHHGSFAAPGSPSSLSGSLIGSPQLTAASSTGAIAAPQSSASSATLPRHGSNGVSIFAQQGNGQSSAFRPPLHKVRSVLSGEEADSEPSSAGSSARGSGGGRSGAHSESGSTLSEAAHRTASDLAAALSLSSRNSGSSQQLSQMALAASGAGAVLRAISRPKAHSFDQPSSRNNNAQASGPLFETDHLSSGGDSAPSSAVKPPQDPQWKQSSSSLNLLLSSHLSSLFPTSAAARPAAPSAASSAAASLYVNTSPSPPPPPAAPGLLRSIFSPFVHWTPRGTVIYMIASLIVARLVRVAGQPARVNRTMLTFGPPFLVREAPQLFALLIGFGLFRTAHQQRACFPSLPLLVGWIANATSLIGLFGLFAQMVRTGARNFRSAMAAAGIPLPAEISASADQESVLTIAAAGHDANGEIQPRVVSAAPIASSSTPADPAAALSPTAVSAYRRLGKMTPLRWFLTATQLTKTLAWYEEVQWKSGVIFEKIYTKHKTHALKLDIYRPKSTGEIKPLPVFLYIHGGGWITGHRSFHSLALLYAICKSGWLVISVSYRLSPWVKHPTHLMDCKRSLAWVKQHARELGADGSTIVVGGESAGAHLACLLALTPNIPYLQPGFEQVDTSVSGVVDLYGPHDFTDSSYHFRCHENPHSVFGGFDVFLHRMVMGTRLSSNPGDYAMASPLFRLSSFPDRPKRIPPFFGCHGTADDLVPVGDSDAFYRQLRKKREQAKREYEEAVERFEAAAATSSSGSGGNSPAPHARVLPPLQPFCLRHHDVYVRVPGASHAFNNVMGPRSFALNDSVTAWLLALLSSLREQRDEMDARKELRARASEHSASVLDDYSTAATTSIAAKRAHSVSSPLESEERRQAEEEERADRQRQAASATDGPLFLLPKL